MKSIIKICDLNNLQDVSKIQNCMAQIEGIIACQISIEKKELQVIYNEAFIKEESIKMQLENQGFVVV